MQAFKSEFFPGEDVSVTLEALERGDGEVRSAGQIREKIRFPGTSESAPFARYFVSLREPPHEEAVVDGNHVARDRKTFTKQILRSYLKNALHREAWSGAPWQVKERLANEYRIPTEIPPHLTYEFQTAQRRAQLNLKKGDFDSQFQQLLAEGNFHELRKSGKTKLSIQDLQRFRQEQFLEYQRAVANDPSLGNGTAASPSDPMFVQYMSQNPGYPFKGVPKPPPTIKYPMEDLEIPPTPSHHRPPLKFLTAEPTHPNTKRNQEQAIHLEAVGPLLETWDTLNVYCEVFYLDSFTFDDYVDALQYHSDQVPCELLDEIHCAVLKRLVNDEKDMNGQTQINLPDMHQDGSDRDSSTTPRTPSPEPNVKTRTTRSSLAKSEAADLKLSAKIHRAADIDQCIKDYGWRARLKKRDFSNGRWVVIAVGLMNLFASVPRLKANLDGILTRLAPVRIEGTEEAVIAQYAGLDINTRVQIIQFLCMLSLETTAIRSYMEDCTISMTSFRKEKIEWQRKRKAA